MKFKVSKVERLICLCVRHCDFLKKKTIKDLYNELGDDLVFKSAQLNGVVSIVAHALSICIEKDKIPDHWSKEYKLIENKIISYMDELNKAADILANQNIPLLALKNSGITLGMYPYLGSCPMGDVDVLVKKSQFREAHNLLVKNGYKLKFRYEF